MAALAVVGGTVLLAQIRDVSAGQAATMAFGLEAVAVVSLLLHEAGHVLAARRLGIDVRGIRLTLLGAGTYISEEGRTPRAAFWLAAGGPLVTAATVLVTQLLAVTLFG